jgi:hypothetical protein
MGKRATPKESLLAKYPPKQNGYSCHHAAYNYAWYQGDLERNRYQHNTAMLLPVRNERHNFGSLALHALLNPPPKPRFMLMADAVDFLEALDPQESRIRRFGQVIGFFEQVAEDEISTYTADQARAIAKQYTDQYVIITQGGEEYIRGQQFRRPIGEAA